MMSPSATVSKAGGVMYTTAEKAISERTFVPEKSQMGIGPVFPKFNKRDIADESLSLVIDSARQTAMEWNLQPWRWIVVRAEAAKERLESASNISVPLSSAPVILVCLADTLAWKSAPQHLQELVASQKITEEQGREVLRRVQEYYSSSPDVAQRTALANSLVAVQQLLLGAASRGLTAYWVTEFDEDRIKTQFHIPDHFLVTALVPLGYCEESAQLPTAKVPPRTLIYKEKFGETLAP